MPRRHALSVSAASCCVLWRRAGVGFQLPSGFLSEGEQTASGREEGRMSLSCLCSAATQGTRDWIDLSPEWAGACARALCRHLSTTPAPPNCEIAARIRGG